MLSTNSFLDEHPLGCAILDDQLTSFLDILQDDNSRSLPAYPSPELHSEKNFVKKSFVNASERILGKKRSAEEVYSTNTCDWDSFMYGDGWDSNDDLNSLFHSSSPASPPISPSLIDNPMDLQPSKMRKMSLPHESVSPVPEYNSSPCLSPVSPPIVPPAEPASVLNVLRGMSMSMSDGERAAMCESLHRLASHMSNPSASPISRNDLDTVALINTRNVSSPYGIVRSNVPPVAPQPSYLSVPNLSTYSQNPNRPTTLSSSAPSIPLLHQHSCPMSYMNMDLTASY